MSEPKHTPGPWEAVNWTCHAPITVRAGGTTIADLNFTGRLAKDCIPDARLIAAAPELLEVCLKMLNEVESMHIDWARFSRNSPDYDPDYKPEFPPCVAEARRIIEKAKVKP